MTAYGMTIQHWSFILIFITSQSSAAPTAQTIISPNIAAATLIWSMAMGTTLYQYKRVCTQLRTEHPSSMPERLRIIGRARTCKQRIHRLHLIAIGGICYGLWIYIHRSRPEEFRSAQAKLVLEGGEEYTVRLF